MGLKGSLRNVSTDVVVVPDSAEWWQTGVPQPPEDDYEPLRGGSDITFSSTFTDFSQEDVEFSMDNDGFQSGEIIAFERNTTLTGVSTLEFIISTSDNVSGANRPTVFINGEEEFTTDEEEDDTLVDIDVSEFGGENLVEFGYVANASSAEITFEFAQITLQ